MTFLADFTDELATMRALLGEVDAALDLPVAVQRLDELQVVELLEQATRFGQVIERVKIAAAGVIAARSGRAAGHAGIAQARGFRNPVAFVQHVTGGTRAEAVRQVRVGESLVMAGGSVPSDGSGRGSDGDIGRVDGSGSRIQGLDAAGEPKASECCEPWHAPLNHALLKGTLSSAQHDAIRRGLGEPMISSTGPGEEGENARNLEVVSETANEAWRLAATELIEEAQRRTVEELAKSARAIRNLLDPAGAQDRFLARFEARSFRMWVDADGRYRGSMVFDDESAAWLIGVIDAALRPRRGGPRFVDPQAQAEATLLQADPRSNDQLAFDLMIDVLKSGTLATPQLVHGARQAGVRIVQIVDRHPVGGAAETVTTTLEDTGCVVPAGVAEQRACAAGSIPVLVTRSGDPLNIGREQRNYNSKQRIALAVRDGGCRWPECDRPASLCEAHHIDLWSEGGQTDIDRGILLCRFHHMQLQNNGWRITRDVSRSGAPLAAGSGHPPSSDSGGPGEFLLHAPGQGRDEGPSGDQGQGGGQGQGQNGGQGQSRVQRPNQDQDQDQDQVHTIPLVPRLPLRYAWGELRPPSHTFRPRRETAGEAVAA